MINKRRLIPVVATVALVSLAAGCGGSSGGDRATSARPVESGSNPNVDAGSGQPGPTNPEQPTEPAGNQPPGNDSATTARYSVTLLEPMVTGAIVPDSMTRGLDLSDTGVAVGEARWPDGSRQPVRWLPPDYRIQVLPAPDTGLPRGAAAGINSAGNITGWKGSATFRWSPDLETFELPLPATVAGAPTDSAFASAINENNEIAGEALSTRGREATLWLPDSSYTRVPLGTLGGDRSTARDMNDATTVVGGSASSDSPTNHLRPFIWTSTTGMQPLPLPQALLTSPDFSGTAEKINNRGQVAGKIIVNPGDNNNFRTLLLRWESDGRVHVLRDLDRLGGDVGGINDAGHITGNFDTLPYDGDEDPFDGGEVVFLYVDGEIINLNERLSPEDQARYRLVMGGPINNAGQILALAEVQDLAGWYSVLLTPQSDPECSKPTTSRGINRPSHPRPSPEC